MLAVNFNMVFLQWIFEGPRFAFIHQTKDENSDEIILGTIAELRVNIWGSGSPGEIYWNAVMVSRDLDKTESYTLNYLFVKGTNSYTCEF